MQGCPDYCTHEVQGYPAPCEMYPLESFAGCARACALERLRAAMNERVDAQRAEIAELRFQLETIRGGAKIIADGMERMAQGKSVRRASSLPDTSRDQ